MHRKGAGGHHLAVERLCSPAPVPFPPSAVAADHGCDLAMMGAAPGSTSQTNAERQGFRIAYTRLKWGLRSRADHRIAPDPMSV